MAVNQNRPQAALSDQPSAVSDQPKRFRPGCLYRFAKRIANAGNVLRKTRRISVLALQWTTLRLFRPTREKKLPVVLSRQEVRRILTEVRIAVYRACLTTIYACGLRPLERAHLQVSDVYSAHLN